MNPVSDVTGRRQIRALRLATRIGFVSALVGIIGLGRVSTVAAGAAVALVVATPMIRVLWLIRRWASEGDRRFVLTGSALLVVVAAGAIISRLFKV